MSESAHIRNLLNQSSSRQNISSKEPVRQGYGSLPRFGLRGASAQVIDNLYSLIFDMFDGYDKNDVLAKYSMYADSDESVFYSSAGNLEDCVPSMQGDFFESFPDLFMTIYISNDHIYGNPPPSPDAIYAHDSENEYDMGEIEMRVYLPPSLDDAMLYLKENRLEICGILAHEMQHVVQKHCYGEPLGNTDTHEVMVHAVDKNEIDARVEEIIASMHESYLEEDKEQFYNILQQHVDKYLIRNLPNDATSRENLKEVMIKNHLDVYLEKMDGIL